jgi:hypothetical protein
MDHIRVQKLSPGFFVPKFALSSVLLVIEIAHAILSNGSAVLDVESSDGGWIQTVGNARIGVFVVIGGAFAAIAYQAVRTIDPSEMFRLYVYIGVFSLVGLLNVIDSLLVKIGNFKLTSGLFTLHFSSLHSFVLLMIFSHWPYEYDADEKYGVAGEENDNRLDLNDSEESS